MKEFILVLVSVVLFYFVSVSLHHLIMPIIDAITGIGNG